VGIIAARTDLVTGRRSGDSHGRAGKAGWVRITDGLIDEVGDGTPPAPANFVADVVVPGFLDLHMHGGGGHDVAVSPADLAAAVAFHRSRGTTATLVSLVTAPVSELVQQLGWIADRAELGRQPDGHVLGAHLEGPFLSPARCGAQNPEHLRLPDRGVLRELIGAAHGQLRCMTIAPELPGALELIDDLVAAGVVAAVGHTDAGYAQTAAAIDRGATLLTHVYNGMRPWHHREPGPSAAAFERNIPCEVINDGVHLHPAVLRAVQAQGRPVLITDAIDATGVGDGRYVLGGQAVQVHNGQARLEARGTLAGSTLTMDAALRRAVAAGLSLEQASAAASATPAAVLGVGHDHAVIEPGRHADLVLLDAHLNLQAVVCE
jgi:N-acetylglucosamine-6-phosphate deacetylase